MIAISDWGHYNEAILTIGEWSLRRRDDERVSPTAYRAMMGHKCHKKNMRLINGEFLSMCIFCKSQIPDEIWGLWHLLCNDQRRGWDV